MAWQEVYTVLHTHTEDLAMVKALITFLTGAVLLTGCNAGMNGYMLTTTTTTTMTRTMYGVSIRIW